MTRHRWIKLRLHVYVCRKCGARKANAARGAEWVTTYDLPTGHAVERATVPPCEAGALTAARLAEHAGAIATYEAIAS